MTHAFSAPALPANYSRQTPDEKLSSVADVLCEIGVDIDLIDANFDPEWVAQAIDSFNAATIIQVLGLASILVENQPLSVRSAMYRGIGILWRDSGDVCYRKCGRLILDMRRRGLVPYRWITNGTRSWDKPSSWSGLADFAETVADAYRKDLWERQADYVEVFVEKDAMSGVISPVTREYDIRLNPIRGFGSETFLYNIAEQWKQIEKPIYVYYLGDHDPAGLAIEADLKRRLTNFAERNVNWRRLAVTDADFASEELLGFPVKRKGSAAKWRPFLEAYGDRCVEVDAIPAPEIRARVKAAIESHIDGREWQFLKDQEVREKQDVFALVRNLQGGL
jgi:hypothetical protein